VVTAGAVATNNEARRLVAQGGVSVDDVRVDDVRATLDATAGRSYLLKVGKRRFVRVTFA
jgi:tyrosyl-tRNA synthetase